MTTNLPNITAGRSARLDVVRGAASVVVVATHVLAVLGAAQTRIWGPAFLQSGELAVSCFFVLSGYLLYGPFVRARMEGTPPPDLHQYARVRVARIVPAYWTALTVLGVLTIAADVTSWRAPFYYAFLQQYFPGTAFNAIKPAWTLGAEVVFYFSLPYVADRIRDRYVRTTSLRPELVLVGLSVPVAFATRAIGARPGSDFLSLWSTHSFASGIDQFAAGMLIAAIVAARRTGAPSPRWVELGRRRSGWLAIACGTSAAIVATVGDFPDNVTFPSSVAPGVAGGLHLLLALTASMIVFSAIVEDSWWQRLPKRAEQALAYAGVVSYGTYLWHFPLLEWSINHIYRPSIQPAPLLVLFLITISISMALGSLSYHLIERPAILRAQRTARQEAR